MAKQFNYPILEHSILATEKIETREIRRQEIQLMMSWWLGSSPQKHFARPLTIVHEHITLPVVPFVVTGKLRYHYISNT